MNTLLGGPVTYSQIVSVIWAYCAIVGDVICLESVDDELSLCDWFLCVQQTVYMHRDIMVAMSKLLTVVSRKDCFCAT